MLQSKFVDLPSVCDGADPRSGCCRITQTQTILCRPWGINPSDQQENSWVIRNSSSWYRRYVYITILLIPTKAHLLARIYSSHSSLYQWSDMKHRNRLRSCILLNCLNPISTCYSTNALTIIYVLNTMYWTIQSVSFIIPSLSSSCNLL